jgi:hypothetical protein
MVILILRRTQMDLAQFLQKAVSPVPKTYLPFSLIEGGLPQGALIELSGLAGGGKLEALIRFLSENPSLPVAWVEEGSTTYPCAFPQQGVSLERLLFVNAEAAHSQEGSRLVECAHQILRTQIFGVLVLLARDSVQQQVYPHNHHTALPGTPRDSRITESRGRREPALGLGEIELRRLQIAAEKSGTTVFIIRETPSVASTWPLTAQFQISRTSPSFGDLRGELRVEILKYKFQRRERFTDENASSQALA